MYRTSNRDGKVGNKLNFLVKIVISFSFPCFQYRVIKHSPCEMNFHVGRWGYSRLVRRPARILLLQVAGIVWESTFLQNANTYQFCCRWRDGRYILLSSVNNKL
jgi:hypothetical protein